MTNDLTLGQLETMRERHYKVLLCYHEIEKLFFKIDQLIAEVLRVEAESEENKLAMLNYLERLDHGA